MSLRQNTFAVSRKMFIWCDKNHFATCHHSNGGFALNSSQDQLYPKCKENKAFA